MIQELFRRHKLAMVLAILLALNAFRFWNGKAMRQRMEGAWKNLPEEQRTAMQARMQADRAFFESLRELPEDQRREKMREHFDQNPPPPGFDPGFPGGGGPGGGGDPANGDPVHLPSPEIRRSMDQQIANSQKQMGGS
jgi:hypothetical protein